MKHALAILLRFVTFSTAIISVLVTSIGDASATSDPVIYVTKFGKLEIVAAPLAPGKPSSIINLDGKPLLTDAMPTDENAYRPRLLDLSYMAISSLDLSLNKDASGTVHPVLNRIVVGEGEGGTCVKQFIMLDFTGAQPYVSKRFGYNLDNQLCLELKRVRWSASGATIYLNGPMTYRYRTSHEVVDAEE